VQDDVLPGRLRRIAERRHVNDAQPRDLRLAGALGQFGEFGIALRLRAERDGKG